MKTLFEKVAVLVKQRIRESVWMRIGLVLSVVVVFCTTYALVLPALTLSSSSSSSVVQQEKETSVTETVESTQSTQDAATTFSTAQEVETQQSSTIQESAPQPTGNQAGQFEVEADNVIVKVSYEAETFTEAVSLKVSAIDDSSGYEQKLSSLLEEKNQILTQTYSYDIAFVNATGVEVEPSKAVDVSIQFKDAVTSTNLQDGWKLYHFINNDVNEVEDLTDDKATDIKQDNLENVTSVEFKSDSFSPYVIAGTSYEDFKPYIVSGNFQGTTTETLHSDGSRTLQTDLKLDYDIPKTELNKSKSYAIELPQDTAWTNINENQEYTGKDGGRDAYKYRFVQENGKKYIVISFLDSYLATAGDKVHGDLIYTATIGQTYRKETGNYEIPFTDKVTITVPSDKIEEKEEPQAGNYDIDSSKDGTVTYDGDQAYLDYTVTVWSNNGTKDAVKISDALAGTGFTIDNLKLQDVTIKKAGFQYYGGNADDQVNPVTISGQPVISGTNFNVTLPKLEAKQKYIITYRYKVSAMEAGKTLYAKNKVTIETPDLPPKTNEKWIELYRNKIGKTGQYDPSTNKIKWTVTVNENKNDIAGAELKDTMIAQASDVQITPSNGATKTATGYTFSATDGGKNTNKYVITYTTDAGEKPNEWGEAAKTVTNTAMITDNGENSSTSVKVTGDKGDTGGLDKSFEKMEATADSNIKTLTWKSTIKVPGSGKIPAGTEFKDSLMAGNNDDWDSHYFTKAQLNAIYQNLVSVFGSGNFEFSAHRSGNNSDPFIPYSQLTDSMTYREFKFKLTKDYTGNNVILNYVSSIKKSQGLVYKNTINSNGYSASDDYVYNETGIVTKMDADRYSWNSITGSDFETEDTSQTIQADGKFSWAVRVALQDDTTSVTITDTPPSDLQLVGFAYGYAYNALGNDQYKIENGSIIWTNSGWSGTYPDIDMIGSISRDGDITVTFTSKNGKTIKQALNNNSNLYARFTFQYVGEKSLDDNVVVKLTNRATATLNGQPVGEDDHTKTTTIQPAQKISKGGSWSNDNREVNYKLDINPYAEDLAAGKASYTVTDTLEYREDLLTNLSYDLKQESVTLYDSNNQEIDKSLWSWTVEKTKDSSGVYKSVLKLTVPNKQKLRLEYSYTVSREVAADDKTDLSVKNTAEVSGFKTGKTENTVSYTWQKMSTSGTAQTTKYFKLTKVDLNNFAIVLPNAIFEVRENITDKVVATYKTGTDGTLYVTKDGKEAISKIEDLKNDTLYYIIEVTSPDGYKLPDTSNQKRYYFYFSDTNSLPSNIGGLVTSLPEMTNLAKQSKQEFVENEQLPPTTSVTVDKKWENADGSDAQRTSGKIIVSLKRISDIDTTPVEIESREVTYDGGQWQTTFNNLPTKGDNGEYYTYFVEEQAVAGYKATYSNASKTSEKPSDVAVSSGTITIINKAQKAYNLPKTGGIGLEPVYLWGIILVALGILLLSLKLYRTYQGGGLL